jgi:hypothetical protein
MLANEHNSIFQCIGLDVIPNLYIRIVKTKLFSFYYCLVEWSTISNYVENNSYLPRFEISFWDKLNYFVLMKKTVKKKNVACCPYEVLLLYDLICCCSSISWSDFSKWTRPFPHCFCFLFVLCDWGFETRPFQNRTMQS